MAITIKPKVTFKDRGFAEVISKMHQLGNKRIQAGVLEPHASAPHPLRSNISIGSVAVMNEYGSDAAGVPERSFIRRAFRTKANRSELVQQLGQAVRQVVKYGALPENALAPVGRVIVGRIQDAILRSPPPPNAPWTVEEKGHAHTLVHTYTLHDSISSRVVAIGRGSRDPGRGGGGLGGGDPGALGADASAPDSAGGGEGDDSRTARDEDSDE